MRKITTLAALLAMVLPALGPAQMRRRGPAVSTVTAGPSNVPAVTFYGTVKVLSKKELVVRLDAPEHSDEPQTLTFRLTHKTKFFKDDRQIQAAEIAAGAHITLEAVREGDQKFTALDVRVVARPRASRRPGGLPYWAFFSFSSSA